MEIATNYHYHPEIILGIEEELRCFLCSHAIDTFICCECTIKEKHLSWMLRALHELTCFALFTW